MNRERSFNAIRHHSRESSTGRSIIGRLFPQDFEERVVKPLNMNDSRKILIRDPAKDFQRSNQQSSLFQKGVKKMQLQLTEKKEKSLTRRYTNKSTFTLNPSVSQQQSRAQQKSHGLKKIKLELAESKISQRKHFEGPTLRSNEDSTLNYIVPAVNPSTNTSSSRQVIIKIGKTYPKPQSQNQNRSVQPGKPAITQRKHFQKDQQNEIVKELLTDRCLKGKIDFNHHYYKPEARIPKRQTVKTQPKLFEDKRGSVSSRLFR